MTLGLGATGFALLAAVVFAATAAVDYLYARYTRALADERVTPHAKARWAVALGATSSIGFIVAVKVTLWTLPFEALGWYVGTYCAAHGPRSCSSGQR